MSARSANRSTQTSTASTAPTSVQAPATPQATGPQTGGFLLNAANWLLSRLPWFNTHYQAWGKGKRIVIGLLMYLIVLPVIPIVIGIILYVHDPESFKNGKAIKVLGSITLLWFGAFGLVAMQPAVPDNPLNSSAKVSDFSAAQKQAPEAKQPENSDTVPPAQRGAAYKKVADKSTSAATKGRFFKNCDAAFAAGVFNIPKSDPAYQPRLDGDSDGIACEK